MGAEKHPTITGSLSALAVGSPYSGNPVLGAYRSGVLSLPTVIELDKDDRVVTYVWTPDPIWMKPCARCSVPVQHLWAPKPGNSLGQHLVPLADHDSQCRP